MSMGRILKRMPGIKLWHKLNELYQLHMVKKTNDNSRLVGIWRKSPYEDVRFDIVNKLQDQDFIALLASEDSSDSVRAEAVKHLQDKGLLQQIASSDRSDFVRAMAKAHYEYTGLEPWYAAKVDKEVSQKIIEYLTQHTSGLKNR